MYIIIVTEKQRQATATLTSVLLCYWRRLIRPTFS